VVVVGQLGDGNLDEYRFGFLTSAEPRQCVSAYELGFGSGAGVHCRLREPIGEGQIGQRDRTVGGFDEQVGIGCEVGVEAQGGAADHDPDVVTLVGGSQFGGDQSAQSPQPGRAARFLRTSP
jgi:hypothetical protein